MDLDALKAELAAGHPVTGAYDADDAVAADQINVVNCERDVTSVSAQTIFEAITLSDYVALSDGHKMLLAMLLGMDPVYVNGTNAKAALVVMFTGTTTLGNLAALQTETVSRAIELGLGFVAPGHVENARM